MPIHEFRCNSCDHVFEVLVMQKDELSNIKCTRCQSPEVQKLMSAANLSVSDSSPKRVTDSGGVPRVQHHSCASGSCSAIELPGHRKG